MKHRAIAATLCYAFACSALDARVTRLVIEERQTHGQVETLSGHFYGELDPQDPHNSLITDIQLAPRNARGMVEYTGTFAISKPVDMARANGVLFYSVPNRGNGAPSPTAEGEVSVVSGWQGDLAPRAGRQTINVPVARNPDGSAVHRTGLRTLHRHGAGHDYARYWRRALFSAHLPEAAHARYHKGVAQ